MPRINPELKSWFDYPDDPDHGKLQIRHLKEGEMTRIMESTTESHVIHIKEFRRNDTVVKRKDTQVELAVASITDWKNFLDESGKPLPFTPENVRRFCMEDGFLSFVAECREILAKTAAGIEEEEEGNS